MRIAIIAKSGPAAGRRIVLRGGQIARVGRTDWADFALPEDVDLADIHFAVHCDSNTAMIQALALDRDTKINGVPTKKGEIQHGDVIEAGTTLFNVEIEGATNMAVELPADSSPVSTTESTSSKNEVREIAEYIGLSKESIELAKASTEPKLFGDVLAQCSDLQDALCWKAHTMPKPQAVLWACSCVEEVMQSEKESVQLAAYQAAIRWGREPNDANREDAKQMAEAAKHEGVGGILAASAGWSGGSLGPSDIPLVPPDDRLTAKCICIALAIANSLGNPAGSTDRLLGFINRLSKAHTNHPLS